MASFWDTRDRLSRRPAPAAAAGDAPAPQSNGAGPPAAILTVSQLTAQIKRVLTDGLPGQIIVRGEVGQWRKQTGSGHCYFNLKDAAAVLECKMWRASAEALKFEPRVGQELIAFGRIDVWAPRGQYSLVCDRLEPVGQGALELAFRQIVEELRAEGLFAAERKRSLPPYPQRIAILTSPQAAAYADVLKVLGHFKHLKLLLYPVPVQGLGAAVKIAEALAHVSHRHGDVGGIDAVLLVRGGGSAEDLWAFNEEVVARALAAMSVPVVVGVGHETDTTIADLAADVRAHTPTEAAQVLVQRWRVAPDAVDQLRILLRREWRDAQRARRDRLRASAAHETFRRPLDTVNQLRQRLDEQGHALAASARRLARETGEKLTAWSVALHANHPRQKVALDRRQIGALAGRLAQAGQRQTTAEAARLATAAGRLRALDPSAVLRRGFSITFVNRTGALLRAATEVRPGDMLTTRTADGEVRSTVGDAEQGKLFE